MENTLIKLTLHDEKKEKGSGCSEVKKAFLSLQAK